MAHRRRQQAGAGSGDQPQEPISVPERTAIFGTLYVGPRNEETDDGIPPISDRQQDRNRLWVGGGVVAEDLFIVSPENWADDVFEPGYPLRPLPDVEDYIKEHGHLPDVPSAGTIRNDGYTVQQMICTMLRKIEELNLYVIQQEKRISELEAEVEKAKSGET